MKLFVTALLYSGALFAQMQPMTPEATIGIPAIDEVRISPDGAQAIFTVTTADLAQNRSTTRLMRLTISSGKSRNVANAPDEPHDLQWSPNSKQVAFLGNRDGHGGVWVLTISSGKLRRVCAYERGNAFLSKAGSMLAWSPDGAQLAFAGTTEPEPPTPDPIVITRIQYKGRTALSDNRRSHLYVVRAAGGSPRQLTRGDTDEHSIAWGGDGSEIIFLSNHEPDPDAKLNYDIFAVNVATGTVRQLTHTPGVEFDPAISPDGRFIAYTATTRDITTIDSIAEDAHVWLVPVTGGAGRELNAALDRRSFRPLWSSDSQFILCTVADHGKLAVYRVARAGGASTALFDRPMQVSSLTVANNGTILAVVTSPTAPPEVYRLDVNPAVPLTHLNKVQWAPSAPRVIHFRSFDGTPIEGWFYPPLVSPSRGRIPMILTIHGGPHEGMFGYRFQSSIEAYAGRGYATLAINPRGTTGYGQKFTDGCVGNWGGGDYKDLMAGVDFVLKAHPEIDPERLGVTGASYGGFMTNWVVTQTTRFKAAVAVSSLSDLISFYATSLYQDLIHADFGGFPWDDDHYALLWKWSPLAHVKRATTPTLLLHGEQDNDVHITQAEEMYTALRRRGIPAELVRYPREGHGFREPRHRADAVSRTLAWMDRFLK